MKVVIDNTRYDTTKLDLICVDVEDNPRGRNTGSKATSLYALPGHEYLLCVVYTFHGKVLESAGVKVSKQKAFGFAKNLADFDTLEAYFPDLVA